MTTKCYNFFHAQPGMKFILLIPTIVGIYYLCVMINTPSKSEFLLFFVILLVGIPCSAELNTKKVLKPPGLAPLGISFSFVECD